MKDLQLKICGLRDPENIRAVIGLGPEFIGLIFYPGSSRYVTDPESLTFLNNLNEKPLITGVFVDPRPEDLAEANGIIHLDAIQLHGSESPAFCKSVRDRGFLVIKAFGINGPDDFRDTRSYEGSADFFLFDTGGNGAGGTGRKYDRTWIRSYAGNTPFLISGGITPEETRFPGHDYLAGADINSRFEDAPGMKNIGLLKTYINEFRNE
jgi:phosphoribosylanthranilate isomerase